MKDAREFSRSILNPNGTTTTTSGSATEAPAPLGRLAMLTDAAIE